MLRGGVAGGGFAIEILALIFEYLDPMSLAEASMVCGVVDLAMHAFTNDLDV